MPQGGKGKEMKQGRKEGTNEGRQIEIMRLFGTRVVHGYVLL